jgi:prepilin-type N-terminal cleavage/methylation domain-containing protein
MRAARRTSGFTLVELLVVFAVLGVLMALVAPLGVKQVERARAQEEWLVLRRTVEGLAFRAFAQGREVTLEARGAELVWRAAGGAEQRLALEHAFFDPAQRIRIDAHGIAAPATLSLSQSGRRRTLDLNEWVGEAK